MKYIVITILLLPYKFSWKKKEKKKRHFLSCIVSPSLKICNLFTSLFISPSDKTRLYLYKTVHTDLYVYEPLVFGSSKKLYTATKQTLTSNS